MSTEKNNVALLDEAYRYWNDNREKAFEKWMELMDDNVHFRSMAEGAPGMEFTKACTSKRELLDYFEVLANEWEMLYYKVDEFVAQDDRIVAIGNTGWVNRRTRKRVDTPKVDVIRMKNSKIVEFFEIYDTAKVLGAARE
ncbi:hypothetical protein BTA51_24165 [Hahella sp. CCB-MM4]|uniref:nuclear transport factor 2 family protein n=1 Tax=Hahella sp. (strain CCB-MM4) TaxID=1926491 RepID=UPI000B9AADB5|nr:nuclear transport factor 2 family protein [Hahella sp. CCB-MM4]OZG70695.1 hypothetical protein BTA51_24165 [Hahella sp. CCB-MM4]